MSFLSCAHDSAVASMHLVCKPCRDAAIAALEARLAEVTAEREFESRCAVSQKARGDEHFTALLEAQRACDALRVEVARLRAAIAAACDALDKQAKAWNSAREEHGVRLATHTIRAALGEP